MAYRARAFVALLSVSMIAAAVPASAQEGALFQNLMQNMGMLPGSGPDIEYRERPPLVVPPSSALPRPQEPGAKRSAAWPNDPDTAARRAAAKDDLIPATEREKYKLGQRPELSPEELRRGRIANQGPAAPASSNSTTFEENIGPIFVGREMAGKKSADAVSQLQYGTEPPRRRLSEPPTGYRRPAGTAVLGPGQNAMPESEDGDSTGQKAFAQGRTR